MSQTEREGSGAPGPSQEQIDGLLRLFDQRQFERTVEQAEKLTALYPGSPALWNIRGAACGALQRHDEAEAAFRRSADLDPVSYAACRNLGGACLQQGKMDEAIEAFGRAAAIRPHDAEAHLNLARAHRQSGNPDEAIASFRKVLAIQPDHAEAHYGLGNALEQMGDFDEALKAFGRVLALRPDHVDTHIVVGNLLKQKGELDEAVEAYRKAIALAPDYFEVYNNLGAVLHKQGRLDEAIVCCDQALAINPNYAEAHNNKANILEEQGRLDEAIVCYGAAVERKPDYAVAQAHFLYLKQQICDWKDRGSLAGICERLGLVTDAVSPFAMLSMEDNAERQFLRTKRYAAEKFKLQRRPTGAVPSSRPKRLKLGYFSADFHDHPVLFLMSGLIREADPERFEVFAYSYGRRKSGAMRDRLKQDADHFHDVADCSDQATTDLARSHSLDIAIDLTGYTRHNRSGLFQRRLAPIQIGYLGYPGTMAADFIDYIIADPIVIPDQQRPFYSEKIIYLPHCYQPNDNTREISGSRSSRVDFGLPDDAFVLCCFNANYKIGPREFDIWMRVMRGIDDGVLWLLKSNAWADRNLRCEAATRGVDPSRIVFADKLPPADHLARHKHADLFIDTFNYNAHTTASDALWAGLPVVTKQGEQFAARVAASLLNAVGLPELITATEQHYEDLILDLASDRARLQRIHEKLVSNRRTQPLFDTRRYTRNFEAGLQSAYDRHFRGQEPADIRVDET